jgi:hypothetical protein
MANTATWKRPGSPIGKRGPRKANPKYKQRARQPWEASEIRELKALARGNTPTGVSVVRSIETDGGVNYRSDRLI